MMEKKRILRRIKASDIHPETWIRPDGLSTCLDCWSRVYMLSDDRDLSASRMKLEGGIDIENDEEPVGYESDPYEAQRKADYKIGEATNTMINDLQAKYVWAIYKKCGIATMWRFPQFDLMIVMLDAMGILKERLEKNVDTAHLF